MPDASSIHGRYYNILDIQSYLKQKQANGNDNHTSPTSSTSSRSNPLIIEDEKFENVALNKPALQSSILRNNNQYREKASNAVNGKTDISHTAKENNPWWKVFLQDQFSIQQVKLYNRPGKGDPILPAEFILEFYSSGKLVHTHENKAPIGQSRGKFKPAVVVNLDPTIVFADMVKITLNACQSLVIGEVEVFGKQYKPFSPPLIAPTPAPFPNPVHPSGLKNLALLKPTKQSSDSLPQQPDVRGQPNLFKSCGLGTDGIGNLFDDALEVPNILSLAKISLGLLNDRIVSLQFTYHTSTRVDNGSGSGRGIVTSREYGKKLSDCNEQHVIKLAEGEAIYMIEGVIFQGTIGTLEFITCLQDNTTNVHGPFGKVEGGERFSIAANIIAFWGCYDDAGILQLGVYSTSPTTSSDSEANDLIKVPNDNRHIASNAVDGDTEISFASTLHEWYPWWKVELNYSFCIRRIVIHKKKGEDKIPSTITVSVFKAGTMVHNVNPPSGIIEEKIIIDIPHGVHGDEVKVSLPSKGSLVLGEVEVYGEDCPPDLKKGVELAIAEIYRLSSYPGRYGKGKVVQTLSLLPHEETDITVQTFRHSTRTMEKSSSILDTLRDEAEDDFQKSVDEEQSRDHKSKSNAHWHSQVFNKSVHFFGSSLLTSAGTRQHVLQKRQEMAKMIGTAVSKHASKASSHRTVNVNTSSKSVLVEEEGTEQAISRNLKNANQNGSLHFFFHQMNQEYFSLLHLVDIRLVYKNSSDGSMEEFAISEIDELLEKFIAEDQKEAIKEYILRRSRYVVDYKGRVRKVVSPFSFDIPDDDIIEEFEGFDNDIVSEYVNNDGQKIEVPGIIVSVEKTTMRTDGVFVDSFRDGNIDEYGQGLQKSKISEKEAQKNPKRSQEKVLEDNGDDSLKEEVTKHLNPPEPKDSVSSCDGTDTSESECDSLDGYGQDPQKKILPISDNKLIEGNGNDALKEEVTKHSNPSGPKDIVSSCGGTDTCESEYDSSPGKDGNSLDDDGQDPQMNELPASENKLIEEQKDIIFSRDAANTSDGELSDAEVNGCKQQ